MILIIDPFPSFYFIHMCKILGKKDNYTVVVPGKLQALFLRGFWNIDACDIATIDKFIDDIDFVIAYSDQRPTWFFLKNKLKNKRVLFFERGLLRGECCQASFSGVNSRSLIASKAKGEWDYDVAKYDGEVDDRKISPSYIAMFFWILANRLDYLFSGSARQFSHQDFSIVKYSKRFFYNKSREYYVNTGADNSKVISLGLQLESDAQFNEQSFFSNNRSFLDYVISIGKEKNFDIIVRTHPNDVSDIDKYILKNFSLKKIPTSVCNIRGYAAINSTWIFEKILDGESVFTFGNSAFSKNTASSLQEVSEIFKIWLDSISRSDAPVWGGGVCYLDKMIGGGDVNRLREWVRSGSLPGDLIRFKLSDIVRSVELILDKKKDLDG